MYRLILGKVSRLSRSQLPTSVVKHAPIGARRASWLAGRVLLSQCLSPLPEIDYNPQGKPYFSAAFSLWFNLSHSADDIALLLSDQGEVGCDIELIRPRTHWQSLAAELFSPAEQAIIAATKPAQQLAVFWRIWTCKEAIVKQHGGSVWQIARLDSTALAHLSISHAQIGALSLAVCTPTPLTANDKNANNLLSKLQPI